MQLAQLRRPIQAAALSAGYRPVLTTFVLPIRPAIQSIPAQPRPANGVEGRRYASVKSQGAYRIPNKKTIAKKLGAKKSGDQYVIPGNIIFKQRGTTWHPGENAIRGRDHTIHASVAGYVKYYRDPERHPNKQFIGVAFEKTDTLPYPKNEPRRRKLGFVAVVRKTHDKKTSNITASGIPKSVTRKGGLYDIEKLEKETWTRDKVEQLRQARRVSKLAAKSPKPEETAAVSTTPSAGSTEAGEASSTEAGETVAGKKKGTRAQQQREFVHPLAFIQKRWLERRRTRKLHLNPRTYSYSESNASIGRLVSRTMYTAPWKLGGRKSRFRAKRRRREERTKQLIADRELVRAEKEKERIAEEKKRAERLAKQRAKGAGKAAGKKAGKEEKPLAA